MMQTKALVIHYPQFHPIAENNEWWGEGFTEWTNVKRGRPFYRGHYQPREPLNDNYYDLSDLSVLESQIRLAREKGVYGFCFYHYYFTGKKLLEKPIENYRDYSNETFPYCLIWANQTWIRTWHRAKGENKILIKQEYGKREEWEKQFYYLLDFFKDERYIKIDGKPVYIIYLPQDIEYRKHMFSLWRKLAVQNGLKGLYLIAMDTIAKNDTREDLYDAYMNFEPLHVLKNDDSYRKVIFRFKDKLLKRFDAVENKVGRRILLRDMYTYDYLTEKIDRIAENIPEKKTFLGVFAGWDNTARKDEEGWIAKKSTPEKFGESVRKSLEKSCDRGNEYIFINAWNEWSEGAYLEPDKRYGYAYLNELEKTIRNFEAKKQRETEPVLLLTATILPQDKKYTSLQNAKQRLRQYRDSLRYYIVDTNIRKIVFCDNSGVDFSKEEFFLLADQYNKELEIIQFIGNNSKIAKYGKGYGEGEIIEYALHHSKLLRRADYFIKVTGRLKIRNINLIRGKLDMSKAYFSKMVKKLEMVDTVMFCIPKEMYMKWFQNAYKRVNDKDGKYMEWVFNKIIYGKKIKIFNLPYYPVIEGISGTTGKEYQKEFGKAIAFYDLLSKWNLFNCDWVNRLLHSMYLKRNLFANSEINRKFRIIEI